MDTFCANCQKQVRTITDKETSTQANLAALVLFLCW